jgi:hypothetical protein
MEHVLLKCSGAYVTSLAFIRCLTGLPLKSPSYEIGVNNTNQAGMHSIIGFTCTMILRALAIEAIQRNRKYIVKAFFYYLCGMSYIYACLMFSVTLFFNVFKVCQRECYCIFPCNFCILCKFHCMDHQDPFRWMA